MRVTDPMAFFLIFVMFIALAGCNGNEGQNLPVNTSAVSQRCIGCHVNNGMSISPVTGGAITAEWLNSPHNTSNPANKSGIGAGCPNCHTPSHNHPEDCGQCHGGSSAIASSFINPDATLQCDVCHASSSVIKPLGTPHFNNNFTGATHPAQYVDLQNQGKCRNCHNPHDNTVLQENKDWAVSGHGDTNGAAWTTEDFKSNAACIRCHTATGYIAYVTAVPAFTLPTGPLPASQAYGVLACNACHASYAFKNSVRNVAQHTAPYNGGLSPQTFPDVGFTNICIPCHAGRENGASVNAVPDFTNANFKNPHYMAAAGLMYVKTGFTNFTSASGTLVTSNGNVANYAKSLVSSDDGGSITSTHRKLGTTLINGDSHNPSFFTPGVLDANGPCVICHINANGQPYRKTSHSLKIDANAYNQVCTYCHTSESGVPLTGSNFQTVFLEPQSTSFKDALTLAESLLHSNYQINYDPAKFPYFFEASGQRVADWTRGTNDQNLGRRLMGACFNINLLNKEPAAYAHARTFTRRLIYDTIDFLDDGKINLSVSSTARNTMPLIYFMDANAYNIGIDPVTGLATPTTLYGATTEGMVFLIAWSRTTGKWSAVERP